MRHVTGKHTRLSDVKSDCGLMSALHARRRVNTTGATDYFLLAELSEEEKAYWKPAEK